MTKLSQTQVANFTSLAGIIVLAANQLGFIWDTNQVVFVIGALWMLGSSAYNFYQRFKKGDLTLGGVRK